MSTENKSENSSSNILDLKPHRVMMMQSFILLQRRRLHLLFSIALSGVWDMLSSQRMKLSSRGWILILEGCGFSPSSVLIFFPYSRNAFSSSCLCDWNSNSLVKIESATDGCRKDNMPSLRALDSYLKEKLGMWLSPATLELHQITWDDPASLLEKIVAYEVCMH